VFIAENGIRGSDGPANFVIVDLIDQLEEGKKKLDQVLVGKAN
jgi:hypothetical protein